jgi:hypothetical protein
MWKFEKIWLCGTLIIIRKPKVLQTDEQTIQPWEIKNITQFLCDGNGSDDSSGQLS